MAKTPNSAETTTALDIKVVESRVDSMRQMVATTDVVDDATLCQVADKIKIVKGLGKMVRAEMEKFTDPAREIIRTAQEKYLPFEKECIRAEMALKDKARIYMAAEEAKRVKKENEIAAKLEAGKIKEQVALKRIEKIGPEVKTVVSESGAKLTIRAVKEVVIVDRGKVPDEYWEIDMVKVRKVALAGIEIPGVEIKNGNSMSA